MIYAFSAYNLDGYRVMVLVDWDMAKYPSAVDQARAENYDKQHFRVLDYCPVWANDAYKVHRKWLELKAHIPFEILFPFVIGEFTLTRLKVARIRRDHDPFKAFAFQWGDVDIASVLECKAIDMIARPCPAIPGYRQYHCGRIAWMVTHPSMCADPIDVYISQTRRLFVENGNHRFAAAIVRGDDEIAVRLYGQGIYSSGAMVGM